VATATGLGCATIPDPSQTGAWTDSFQNIQCYGTLKVNAILNEIDGKTHNGSRARVPNIFGMNFQAVSVGQKLIESGTKGGYLDAAATPSEELVKEIQFVDASVGLMVSELRKKHLLESTLIVISAKHGQSPIDPNRFFPIPGHSGANGESPANAIASYLPLSESPTNPTGIGPTEDDISLLWLKQHSDTKAAVEVLESKGTQIGTGQIFYGATLAEMFDVPGLPPNDPRTPDIIVAPNYGVVYTGSTKKQEEHGGFSHDDTNVVLLLSNPDLRKKTVQAEVQAVQVAPTILQVLGLEPTALTAVRKEGTSVLPEITFNSIW
jgi:arylsulfatase A-like enzyme